MQPASLSTGIPSLDRTIERVMLGDNIVWLVSSPEQYDYFVSRFIGHCVAERIRLTYVHFDERIDYSLFPGVVDVEVLDIDPTRGPEGLADLVTEHIRAAQPGAHYLFDNLSVLASEWQEDAFVDFFRLVCPLLFRVEAVACFALVKGRQSNSAVAKVRDTAQIVLDVYEDDARVMLRPIKVWDRYAEHMFDVHVLSAGQFIPLASATGGAAVATAPTEADLLAGYQVRSKDSKSLSIREELIRSIISNRPEYIRIARDFFSVSDIMEVKSRIVGSGTIGGKAAGVLLSNSIIRAACEAEGISDRLSQLRQPESFFIGSGVYFNFLINNSLMQWLDVKYSSPDEMRTSFPALGSEFQKGEFPRAIRYGLRRIVEAFRGSPIIVRSSSLLEDSFNMAFAGKYESVFLGNQGSDEECLERLLAAVKQVYASSLGPDALAYRQRQGLLEFQERMAILIQRVVGGRYGELFFPAVAGVAFSRNPYPWSDRIDASAGLARLVVGLGTRAVNRVEADYPRLVALSHPGLHPDGEYMTSPRYHQRLMDAVDLRSNSLTTVAIRDCVGPDYRSGFYLFSVFEDGFMRAPVSHFRFGPACRLAVTFQNLIDRTDFVDLMRYVLSRVEESYRYPVDIEFALDVGRDDRVSFYLLQCRPLAQRTEFRPPDIPQGLLDDSIVFISRKAVPNGELHDVRYIALIDSRSYNQVPNNEVRSRLARAVGAINHDPRVIAGHFILVGPGRWGSVNLELGVPVTYAEINNVDLLMEMARPRDGYTPEVSYGTHFFQDLVESETFYLPLYPEDPTSGYNEQFLDGAPNVLADLLPAYADVAPYLKLIDVPDAADGRYLHVAMNQRESVGIGYLAPRSHRRG
jgi:pyruvate,water dikinase